MISAVTKAVAESLDSPMESIRVIVTEVPPTHWATGDVTIAEKLAAKASSGTAQQDRAEGAAPG